MRERKMVEWSGIADRAEGDGDAVCEREAVAAWLPGC